MKEYKILTCQYSNVLSNDVTRKLHEGWELHGSVAIKSVIYDDVPTDNYAQAMVRNISDDR